MYIRFGFGYFIAGFIVAFITGNLQLFDNGQVGLMKAVLAVLLWPAVVGGFISDVFNLSTGIAL